MIQSIKPIAEHGDVSGPSIIVQALLDDAPAERATHFIIRWAARNSCRIILVSMLLASKVSAQCEVDPRLILPLRTAEGAPAYVEAPSLVTTPGGVTLLGVPAMRWWKPNVFFPPFTNDVDSAVLARHVDDLLSFAGAEFRSQDKVLRLQRPPQSPERLGRPLAVRNKRGSIDVVFSSQSESSEAGGATTKLWHYELTGRVWSSGTRVDIPGSLYWSRESSVVLAADAGTIALSTHFEAGKGGGIVVARHDRTGWHTRTIPVKGLPYYLTALRQSRDTAVVVFGATDEMSSESNGSHLFQMLVSLREGTSSAPERIQWSARNAVVRPVLLSSSRHGRVPHAISLVWGVATHGATDAESLFVASSVDDGRTWKRRASASLDHPLSNISTTMLEGGVIVTSGLDASRPGRVVRTPRIYVTRQSTITTASLRGLPDDVIDVTTGPAQTNDAFVIVWAMTKQSRPGAAERAPFSGLAIATISCAGKHD